MDFAIYYALLMQTLTIVPFYYPPMDIRSEYLLLTATLYNRWRPRMSFYFQVRFILGVTFLAVISPPPPLFLSFEIGQSWFQSN